MNQERLINGLKPSDAFGKVVRLTMKGKDIGAFGLVRGVYPHPTRPKWTCVDVFALTGPHAGSIMFDISKNFHFHFVTKDELWLLEELLCEELRAAFGREISGCNDIWRLFGLVQQLHNKR